MLRTLLKSEEGQGLVEYAMILVLVVIMAIAIVAIIGTRVSNMYSSVNSGVPSR